MRRLRRLSRRERLWVQEAIDQLCAYHRVSDRDEDYRSVAWTAFFGAYRRFYAVSSPDFWPYAYEQISAALAVEKRIRQDWVYRILSLHVPAAPGSDETLLTRLPDRRGDFTNGVSFRDFLSRQPRDTARLAFHLMDGDSMEEARSLLGMTDKELRCAVEQLREALARYCAI